MPKTKTAEPKVEEPKEAPEAVAETRVDEYALDTFGSIGLLKGGRLPDELVTIYNNFKGVRDKFGGKRLSAEGFATVVTLYRLFTAEA